MEPKGTRLYKRGRVLVNIETEDDAPPIWYWRDPPPEPSPEFVETKRLRERREEYERTRKESWKTFKNTKAFSNPLHHGYGGPDAAWPFTYVRAVKDLRYRQGVKNAIKADWTAQNWKFEADKLMETLEFEEWAHKMETDYEFARNFVPE